MLRRIKKHVTIARCGGKALLATLFEDPIKALAAACKRAPHPRMAKREGACLRRAKRSASGDEPLSLGWCFVVAIHESESGDDRRYGDRVMHKLHRRVWLSPTRQ